MAKALFEQRTHTGEIEVRQEGDKLQINGYAAVFDSRSEDLGGFVEQIDPAAFNKTIKEADVRALINHDPNMVLGRTASGTLKVSVDSRGLHYTVDPPDTTYARDLLVSMERGDINRSSFAFRTIHDSWGQTDDEYPLRTLMEVALRDVSVVTYPAYPEASSGIGREAALAGIAFRSGLSIEELSTADSLLGAIRAQVSDKAWGDFSAADYTDEQYRRACLIVMGDTKDEMKLPVREPDGTLNRGGVHAAAAALDGARGGVDAPEDLKIAAAKKLVTIYRQDLKEDPPEALVALANSQRSEPDPQVDVPAEVTTPDDWATWKEQATRYLRVIESGLYLPNL